jgi:hypothetical protein
MSQAAKAQEPSMEEILASIRRIIADDDASKPARLPEPAALKALGAVMAVITASPGPDIFSLRAIWHANHENGVNPGARFTPLVSNVLPGRHHGAGAGQKTKAQPKARIWVNCRAIGRKLAPMLAPECQV